MKIKRILVTLLGMLLVFSFISCNNSSESSDDNEYGLFDVTDVEGWDNWDDLTSGTIENWIVGKWDVKSRLLTNMNAKMENELTEVTCLANFTGTSGSSPIEWSNYSDSSLQNTSTSLSNFKSEMNAKYDKDCWDSYIQSFKDEGVKVESVEKEVWKKVNKERTQMEFYKVLILSGTIDGIYNTAVIQVNESFTKR